MSAVPSGSVVTVGYQRPARMSGWRVHRSVQGSNVNTQRLPLKSEPGPPAGSGYARLPPATSTRPSARTVWPEHQRFAAFTTPLG